MATNEGTCGYNKDMKGNKLTTPGGLSEKKIEVDDKTEFKLDLKHLMDKHALKETIQFVMENNPKLNKEGVKKEVREIKKLGETLTEELCKKGKAYIRKRKAAGEKSSAYLSGRAVKVCKGQMKG